MKRKSGVLLHISSLWGDYSCGAFGQAGREFVDFLREAGFSYWQVLPFCQPDGYDSPYTSHSVFSLNPNFIDLESLFHDGLFTREELLAAVQHSPYRCEFERLRQERFALLGKAAARFSGAAELTAFLAEHPHTETFCRFMAVRARNGGRPCCEWESEQADESVLRTWRFICFTFVRQWQALKDYANRRGIRIIGDIPIYTALDSSDVWEAPGQFQLGPDLRPTRVAGVPPDYFSADGQLWGNPLYDWDAMRADGFAWWCDRMRFMGELFDCIRIDHFRGLESYYSCAADAPDAREGVWVKGPGMELIRRLKAVCRGREIIAEDLGVTTPAVQALVKASGFPGMRVFQFAFQGDPESPHLPHHFTPDCIAYTGTHDNNTLLGYIWELDAATRRRVLDYCGFNREDWDSRDAYFSILRTMLRSTAGTVIFPLQDLLLYGSDARMNTPGEKEGNWAWRVTREQIAALDRAELRRLNELYGRCGAEE